MFSRKFLMFHLTLWINFGIHFFGTCYFHIVCILKHSFISIIENKISFCESYPYDWTRVRYKKVLRWCWNDAVVPRWCWDGVVVPRWCRYGAAVLRVPNLPFPPWRDLCSPYIFLYIQLRKMSICKDTTELVIQLGKTAVFKQPLRDDKLDDWQINKGII